MDTNHNVQVWVLEFAVAQAYNYICSNKFLLTHLLNFKKTMLILQIKQHFLMTFNQSPSQNQWKPCMLVG